MKKKVVVLNTIGGKAVLVYTPDKKAPKGIRCERYVLPLEEAKKYVAKLEKKGYSIDWRVPG